MRSCLTIILICFWALADVTLGAEKEQSSVGSDEVRLVHDLLGRAEEQGYRLTRPVQNVQDGITIHFALSLVQVMDFDEKNQILTVNVWKHYKWMDEFQTWNASDYGGVDKVILPSDALWTPDIVLYDNMVKRDIENHKEKLRLRSNGEIEWVPYVVYKSACRVDMSNFPFDTQTCSLKFGSWSYAAKELDLVFLNDEADVRMDQTIEDIEWAISGTKAQRNVKPYNCCPAEDYVDLTFELTLQRNWGYFVKFMLFPTLLLSFLALITFWIPPTRADRSGLGTSLMASYMLLLILVTSISPPAHDIKFVNYICSMMAMAFGIVVYCVAMLSVCNRTVPVPASTKKYLLNSPFGRLCLCLPKPDKQQAVTPDHLEPAGDNKLLEATDTAEKAREQAEKDRNHEDWLRVVTVIDRICFLVCAVYMIVCLIVFFPRP